MAPQAVPPPHRSTRWRRWRTWLTGRSWVSYSLELPRTRRFWLTALGRPFAARLQLVAPDLRAVLRAVELGLGVSLLPEFVCADALAQGRVVELFPVSHLTPEEPWFACAPRRCRSPCGERTARRVAGPHAPDGPSLIV